MIYFLYAIGFGLILFSIFCRSEIKADKDPVRHGVECFDGLDGVEFLGHVGSFYYRVSIDGVPVTILLPPFQTKEDAANQVLFIRARREAQK